MEDLKQDAFNKIKSVVTKGNLDITDKEICEVIEDMSEEKVKLIDILKYEHAERCLQLINNLTNSDFHKDSSLQSVLNAISDKWDLL